MNCPTPQTLALFSGPHKTRKVSLETRIETPKPDEIGFSLLPHVLGPGYE